MPDYIAQRARRAMYPCVNQGCGRFTKFSGRFCLLCQEEFDVAQREGRPFLNERDRAACAVMARFLVWVEMEMAVQEWCSKWIAEVSFVRQERRQQLVTALVEGRLHLVWPP